MICHQLPLMHQPRNCILSTTFNEFLSLLSIDSKTRGHQFENFVKWFLKNDPEWKTQVVDIWLWNEWPLRWGPDCGIDLVFSHINGELWAVQAKCISPDREIKKSEIDSFISESNDEIFQARLLISTTDGLGRNARQVIERQEKKFICFLLDNFTKAEVVYPSTLDDFRGAGAKPKKIALPHQELAISAVIDGFRSNSSGQLIMACGTGKTLTSLWIKENLYAARTLVLVPSLNLLAQTLREWTASANTLFKWLCVCSDSTVVNERDADIWVNNTLEMGIPVTNSIEEIHSFLTIPDNLVIFSTYQSSPLIATAFRDEKIKPFDIVFADEAHRCAGKKSETFGCILDNNLIPSRKRLYMTATPRYVSDRIKNRSNEQDISVISMDDESVFGPVFHHFKFSQAIAQGLLSDYQLAVIVIDEISIKKAIDSRKLFKIKEEIEIDAETLAIHIAVAKAMNDYDLQRVITFHGRVGGAKLFAVNHPKILSWMADINSHQEIVHTDYVSGEMSSFARNSKIKKLKAISHPNRGILSNARCLSEGVDIPALDGIVFVDPRSSQVDIVQAVGRAIRKSHNKTHGTIIIPIFIDSTKDVGNELDSSRFKTIWDVVKALRAHDESLSYELDQLRLKLGSQNRIIDLGAALASKIILDLPSSCSPKFPDSLKTKLVEETTQSWYFWYGLLLRHIKTNGNCCIPAKYKTNEGLNLGGWVAKQREARHTMPKERVVLLDKLSSWSWSIKDEQWNLWYSRLIVYSEIFGNARPPDKYKDEDGFRLGGWVTDQRKDRIRMPTDRVKKLEELPGWTWSASDEKWDIGYLNLLEFIKLNAGCSPPQKFKTSSGYPLGAWVSSQRVRKDSLSPDRISKLEEIPGWLWNSKEHDLDITFKKGIQSLKIFLQATGTPTPPAKYITDDGFSLGAWVARQRQRFKRNSLDQLHISQLESITGWNWSPLEDRWKEMYDQLVTYIHQQGISVVEISSTLPEGSPLINWVYRQRAHRADLTTEQIYLLESLDGWAWRVKPNWNQSFDSLKLYAFVNGHSNPEPEEVFEGAEIGKWVRRQKYRRKLLSANKIAQLESLPGWEWLQNN